MAGVFWGGSRADEVADFDEYDPTPYGGGYDIALTFGRPLPPSEETCYPISTSTSTSSSSYDRPQYQQHGGRGHEQPDADEGYDAADHRRKLHAESHGSAAGYGGRGGGGYVRRSQPHEETHGSVGSGYGYGRKGHDNDDDEQAYRKPKPVYGDDDEQAYRKPKPAYGDDRPKYHGGGDDERPSYGRKKKGGDDDSDDDDDERRKPRYKKKDDDDSDDDNKKRYEKNNRRRHDYDD